MERLLLVTFLSCCIVSFGAVAINVVVLSNFKRNIEDKINAIEAQIAIQDEKNRVAQENS